MIKQKTNDIFEVVSVRKIVAMCILTFGLFVVFKLYSFSNQINPRVRSPIPIWFMRAAVVIHLLSFFSLVLFYAIDGPQALLIFSKIMHGLSSIFHLTWIIKVRNRINEVNHVKKRDKLWLRPFLSSFFHVIYMQKKINESILNTEDNDKTVNIGNK